MITCIHILANIVLSTQNNQTKVLISVTFAFPAFITNDKTLFQHLPVEVARGQTHSAAHRVNNSRSQDDACNTSQDTDKHTPMLQDISLSLPQSQFNQ